MPPQRGLRSGGRGDFVAHNPRGFVIRPTARPRGPRRRSPGALARALLYVESEVTIMPHNPMPEKSPLTHAAKPSKRSSAALKNEGEGSRSAARNYNKATEQYVKSGRVEEAAKKAAAALDGPEGGSLREAELVARATEPADDERPTTPMQPREPEDKSEEGFQEPELMKDASEDRE